MRIVLSSLLMALALGALDLSYHLSPHGFIDYHFELFFVQHHRRKIILGRSRMVVLPEAYLFRAIIVGYITDGVLTLR